MLGGVTDLWNKSAGGASSGENLAGQEYEQCQLKKDKTKHGGHNVEGGEGEGLRHGGCGVSDCSR